MGYCAGRAFIADGGGQFVHPAGFRGSFLRGGLFGGLSLLRATRAFVDATGCLRAAGFLRATGFLSGLRSLFATMASDSAAVPAVNYALAEGLAVSPPPAEDYAWILHD